MIEIIGAMLLGVVCGFILRKVRVSAPKISRIVSVLISTLIFMLLFLLGVEVGGDKEILLNFDKIGMEALILSIFAVLGSALFAFLLQYMIEKKAKSEKK